MGWNYFSIPKIQRYSWKWICNFTPYFTVHMITYPSWDITLAKGFPKIQASDGDGLPAGTTLFTNLDLFLPYHLTPSRYIAPFEDFISNREVLSPPVYTINIVSSKKVMQLWTLVQRRQLQWRLNWETLYETLQTDMTCSVLVHEPFKVSENIYI